MPLPALAEMLVSFIPAFLLADAELRTLTGGVVSGDPRMYWYYQAEASITASKPAYLSYTQISTPSERGGLREPVYSFRIYSYDLTRAVQIETRLFELFDLKVLNSALGELTGEVIQAQDLYDQMTKFAGREVHVRFGVLTATVRT